MELQVFKNSEFGELGVIEENGKIFFPASACAKVLGYAKPHNAIKRHCTHALKRGVGVETGYKKDGSIAKQQVEMNFITEGDLYRLIVNSKLPSAEKFERWVFDEVLPTIRKSGNYGVVRVESLDQEYIKNIIETTVSATILIIKEIVPIIKEVVKSSSQTELEEYTREFPRKRRCNGKIDKLNRDIKSEVEQMLSDGVPYRVICDFLAENDVKCSQMAISNYARKYFDVLEMLRNNAYRWGI